MIGMLAGMVLTAAAVSAGVQGSAVPAAPGVAASQAAPIVQCMRANIPTMVQIRELELTTRDRAGGERVLRGRLYIANENQRFRAMLKIGSPPDLAGAAYLMREGESADEIYVYVPALNKVRRVTGGNMEGPLWGTDLSYNDIKQVQNAFSDSTARLEAQGELDQQPVSILNFTPPAGETSHYTLIRAWVARPACVPLKVEFLEGGTPTKRMTVNPADLKQDGKRWYASRILMADLRQNTSTRIQITGVSNDAKLADRYFNPATFYIGN